MSENFKTHQSKMWRLKSMVFLLIAFCLPYFFEKQANAQGGWEVWNIHLKNGKTLFASPLVSADEKTVIYTIGSKYRHNNSIAGAFRIKREKIDYIENATEDTRPKLLLSGMFKTDVVLLRNGQKLFGRITKISSKDLWHTILLIDGNPVDLRNVDIIKFAAVDGKKITESTNLKSVMTGW